MSTMTKKAKKAKKKIAKKSQALVPVTAPTEKDLDAEKSGGKYMLVPSFLKEKQILKILQKTPKAHVFTRPGKGGKEFDYVTGTFMKKVLNYVFGWNWDFEIISEREINLEKKNEGQIIVRGKLTVKDGKGNTISKEQYGRVDVKYVKDQNKFVDLGNDYKAAATDALKKCAAEFGIASDIYGKNEFKEIDRPIQETAVVKDDVTIEADADFDGSHVCNVCDAIITEQEAHYSKKMFGKELCREHQRTAKRK